MQEALGSLHGKNKNKEDTTGEVRTHGRVELLHRRRQGQVQKRGVGGRSGSGLKLM